MSSFTTNLVVSPLPNGRDWRLVEPFDYYVGEEGSKDCIHVPAGFVTDFASTHILQWVSVLLTVTYGLLVLLTRVPAWLGIVFLLTILAGLLITPYGKPGKAAVLHDWLYYLKDRPRVEADQIFREAMCVLKVAPWKCFLMYLGVRVGGFFVWKVIHLSHKARYANAV